jgi:YrbI family 3-deoxy-D-manno-octulosonate 8-phosphate phosphatase
MTAFRLLVLDFDGVLTDNRVLVDVEGREAAWCHRGDGMGIGLVREAGLEVVILSKEKVPIASARARKLGIECIQGCDDKLPRLRELAAARGLAPEQVAYVGNDINDLACLGWVGLPIAVADALPEVKTAARWVTNAPGGQGAVREVCDQFLFQRKTKPTS